MRGTLCCISPPPKERFAETGMLFRHSSFAVLGYVLACGDSSPLRLVPIGPLIPTPNLKELDALF